MGFRGHGDMGVRGHGVEGTSGHRSSIRSATQKELHTFRTWVRGHGVRGHVDMGTLLN